MNRLNHIQYELAYRRAMADHGWYHDEWEVHANLKQYLVDPEQYIASNPELYAILEKHAPTVSEMNRGLDMSRATTVLQMLANMDAHHG